MENEQKQYELICILEPHLESADLENFKKDLEKMAIDNGGQVKHFMEPEKRELAYPINKQSQGIYIVSHLIFEANNIAEFLKGLKTNKLILRHLVTILEVPQESTSEKSKISRKPRIRREEETKDKPSFVKTTEDKDEKLNLEEIDKKLDELVGL
jgi:small subunit ribosomal protein S6